MNKQTNNISLIPSTTIIEGAGVVVKRTIGTHVFRNYDPFILLDYFNNDSPDEYKAGFPSHPHRGFNTFTYIIDGHLEHHDSMGNTGILTAGGAQWMKAGSGVIHSEMPKQENGLMRGFQLWVNLPAASKMDAPKYQEYKSEAFPLVKTTNYSIKLLIGSIDNVTAPIVDTITNVSYFDVRVKAGKPFQYKFPEEHNSFLFLFEGSGQLNGQNVALDMLILLTHTNPAFIAGEQGARLIVVSGKPINEPIAQHGPFVMNTREEIDQAINDFQSNNFVRNHVWVKPH